MSVQVVLLVLGSYLVGSIPSAYLAMKWARGIDIRRVGTGNVGAANVLTIGPKWLAIPVTLADISKGAVCVWAAQLLGLGSTQQVAAGLAAIIGHNWPIYLRFSGGRGVFSSLGVITVLSPPLGLYALVMPYLLFAPIKQVAFGVFLAYLSLPPLAWSLSGTLGITERLPVTLGLVLIALIGLVRRLLVPRTTLSRTIPLPNLIINRLLFDRDIADRATWIRQKAAQDEADQEPSTS